jgi:trk system potassium uptake protein TrkA
MNEKIFLVIGLGTFGLQTCEELVKKGARVIAADNRPDLIEKVKDGVTQAILLDSTDEESLSTLPIEDIDMAIIAIGGNIEANILTTTLLKKAGIPYIIARATSELHHRVLSAVGANEIINIEKDAGRRLAEKIISPDVLDRVPITLEISIAEVWVPETFIGKTLEELDIPRRMSLTVSAIKRSDLSVDEEGNPIKTEKVVFPTGTTNLTAGDILLVVGKDEDIDRMRGI